VLFIDACCLHCCSRDTFVECWHCRFAYRFSHSYHTPCVLPATSPLRIDLRLHLCRSTTTLVPTTAHLYRGKRNNTALRGITRSRGSGSSRRGATPMRLHTQHSYRLLYYSACIILQPTPLPADWWTRYPSRVSFSGLPVPCVNTMARLSSGLPT